MDDAGKGATPGGDVPAPLADADWGTVHPTAPAGPASPHTPPRAPVYPGSPTVGAAPPPPPPVPGAMPWSSAPSAPVGWSAPANAWSTTGSPAPAAYPVATRPGLWRPGDVGVVSFLLGFPAGFGLAIDNARREQRRGQAAALIVAFIVATVVLLTLSTGAVVAAALSIGIAVLLWRIAVANSQPWRAKGMVSDRPGIAGAVVAIVGGWLSFLLIAVVVGFALLAVRSTASGPDISGLVPSSGPVVTTVPTETGSPSPSPKPTPRPTTSASPSDAPEPTLEPGATTWPSSPPDVFVLHMDPELEASLPSSVNGAGIQYNSVRGIILFRDMYQFDDSDTEDWVSSIMDAGLVPDDVSYAFDSSLTMSDSSIEAFRAKGLDMQTLSSSLGISATDILLLDPSAGTFTDLTLAGKHVQRGTHEMLGSSYVVTLSPYIYLRGDTAYLIIAHDDAWAEAALKQLP